MSGFEENRHDSAVALEYDGDIPRVLAKARGLLCGRILEIAREKNIPIYRDGDLAETLALIDMGSPIPETLFTAVARVLAHCYQVNRKFKKKIDRLGGR